MKESLLLLPIEPFELGAVYTAGVPLPLHCTLMHWFELDNIVNRYSFMNGMENLDIKIHEIELVSKAPALFGSNNDIPVHMLERSQPLHILHNRIFALLAMQNLLPQELRWIGAGYNPHVTDTATRSFKPGERHSPAEIVRIERIDGGNRVVRTRWYSEN